MYNFAIKKRKLLLHVSTNSILGSFAYCVPGYLKVIFITMLGSQSYKTLLSKHHAHMSSQVDLNGLTHMIKHMGD